MPSVVNVKDFEMLIVHVTEFFLSLLLDRIVTFLLLFGKFIRVLFLGV